jgi:hypothetical protein
MAEWRSRYVPAVTIAATPHRALARREVIER